MLHRHGNATPPPLSASTVSAVSALLGRCSRSGQNNLFKHGADCLWSVESPSSCGVTATCQNFTEVQSHSSQLVEEKKGFFPLSNLYELK